MAKESKSGWRHWIREPFVHFAILGALLFVGHALWQSARDYEANTILVDPAEMERRAILFAGENQRNPTEEELQLLLYDFVQEEALVREAERLGLDEGDTIIRRRLAQKVRFTLEDNVEIEAPDEATLCAYFDENPQRFSQPPRRSFSHIFITPGELSDTQLRSKADALKAQANAGNWESLGDPFLLNRQYERASLPDVGRSFGPAFARALFSAEVGGGAFQGPFPSSFGLHLVRVDGEEAMVVPQCSDILTELESEWRGDQREQSNALAIRAIIDQYEVVVAE
ncbi:MAG: peptidyl-prolyl cis-trans isomerase [Marivita sp.]|uniref:peptidylprolyl isomerase n=1 Tax=Marivita sp. TaxID=2003365 RepID=UPI003EF5782E